MTVYPMEGCEMDRRKRTRAAARRKAHVTFCEKRNAARGFTGSQVNEYARRKGLAHHVALLEFLKREA